jgi:serine beta-lactamase-like protein LACTB, mitochondrial
MVATHVDTGEPMSNDATFYEVEDRRYKKTFRVDNSNKLPSGGILSTPSDMTRLGQQMIAPTLFSDQTRDVLTRHQSLTDGRTNPQGYALGWRHHEAKLLEGAVITTWFHHHGVAYGAVSHFSVYPEYGVVVSVMMNKNQGAFGQLPARLTDLFVSAIKARRATKTANEGRS